MKKRILVLLTFIMAGLTAVAQTENKVALSLGVEASFASQNAIGGPGFSAKMELPLTTQLKFTVSAGYLVNYYGTRYISPSMTAYCPTCNIPTGPINSGPYEFIPVKAGFRYYFKHLYLDGIAGDALAANMTAGSFIYGGAFGGLIPFNHRNALDLNIGFERGYKFLDYSQTIDEIALRIAYRFRL
jgi:hypothetical protein